MSKPVVLYGALLALSLGAAWHRYTSDTTAPKEGVVLADGKKDELRRVVYTSADLVVTYETRTDDFGTYGWVVVDETRTKKVDGQEVKEPKQTRFKAGTAADKLVEGMAPLVALRELKDVASDKVTTFGLENPTTKLEVDLGGRTTSLAVGGETYGSKDVYVRDVPTQRIFVVDDELFKSLKFAGTRLPERNLVAAKVEDIDGITLTQGASVVSWTQAARADREAAYWKREGGAADAASKDEGFGIWMDKLLKVKSTSYVQEGEAPAELVQAFELKIASANGKPETLVFSRGGDDWYAKSESTRGLVKLPRGAAKDAADDVADVLEGKAPVEATKPGAAATPPGADEAPPSTPAASTSERPSPLPMPPLGAKPPVPVKK
jgi:hypothetical protein